MRGELLGLPDEGKPVHIRHPDIRDGNGYIMQPDCLQCLSAGFCLQYLPEFKPQITKTCDQAFSYKLLIICYQQVYFHLFVLLSE